MFASSIPRSTIQKYVSKDDSSVYWSFPGFARALASGMFASSILRSTIQSMFPKMILPCIDDLGSQEHWQLSLFTNFLWVRKSAGKGVDLEKTQSSVRKSAGKRVDLEKKHLLFASSQERWQVSLKQKKRLSSFGGRLV